MAGREERWAIIDESEHTLTVINPWQFEIGQCCVITRRHIATLLDLSDQECGAIIFAAKRVAEALVRTYQPLGILTFQNNGVYSGQETPHFHFHVVPRQKGSDWGIGPPQSRRSTARDAKDALHTIQVAMRSVECACKRLPSNSPTPRI